MNCGHVLQLNRLQEFRSELLTTVVITVECLLYVLREDKVGICTLISKDRVVLVHQRGEVILREARCGELQVEELEHGLHILQRCISRYNVLVVAYANACTCGLTRELLAKVTCRELRDTRH